MKMYLAVCSTCSRLYHKSTPCLLLQAFPPTVRYLYHTSVLTGEGWVLELLAGQPWQIWTELGVRYYVFEQLTTTL
jgi:hypothetical protein